MIWVAIVVASTIAWILTLVGGLVLAVLDRTVDHFLGGHQ